jgi:hypothetical protein
MYMRLDPTSPTMAAGLPPTRRSRCSTSKSAEEKGSFRRSARVCGVEERREGPLPSADAFGIVEATEGKKAGDGRSPRTPLMTIVDPRKEWLQMFNEAWRLERDFYYDPGMGGLDWKAVGGKYRPLVAYVAHRSDLNYILGEMIGELATSQPTSAAATRRRSAASKWGCSARTSSSTSNPDAYRFKKVYLDSAWGSSSLAPLAEREWSEGRGTTCSR